MRGALLMARQNHFDVFLLVQYVEKLEDDSAGDAEKHIHALLLQ
jgi:hypothetical protein